MCGATYELTPACWCDGGSGEIIELLQMLLDERTVGMLLSEAELAVLMDLFDDTLLLGECGDTMDEPEDPLWQLEVYELALVGLTLPRLGACEVLERAWGSWLRGTVSAAATGAAAEAATVAAAAACVCC